MKPSPQKTNQKPKIPLVMVTCYDATFAKICARIPQINYLLVGDSLGMVIKGDDSTVDVTLDEMIYHTKAVKRGLKNSGSSFLPLVISDMSIGTYEDPEKAVKNALRLEAAGAHLVKVEGPCYEVVKALREADLRVCAHIGLTPQSILEYRVQGRSESEAARLKAEALGLEAAGAELIVFEMIPADLAKEMTQSLKIPSIGIGAGSHCDGQVLVLYDLLGFNADFNPKFLKKFWNGAADTAAALEAYAEEVRAGSYPAPQHSFRAASKNSETSAKENRENLQDLPRPS